MNEKYLCFMFESKDILHFCDRLLGGMIFQMCDEWREQMVECLALTEALIDFAENEV